MSSIINPISTVSQWHNRIRVSFDLDDTLTSHCRTLPIEKGYLPTFMHHWLGEPLRRGTKKLFRELRNRNCSIWIYTSSGRSSSYIKRWFLLHGIRIDGVVNASRHHNAEKPRYLRRFPSKFPPVFGIDLHIDDSEGVKMEGHEHGFRVLVIDPHDENWVERVLDAVVTLQNT